MKALIEIMKNKGRWVVRISIPSMLVFALFLQDPARLIPGAEKCNLDINDEEFNADDVCVQDIWESWWYRYTHEGKLPPGEYDYYK